MESSSYGAVTETHSCLSGDLVGLIRRRLKKECKVNIRRTNGKVFLPFVWMYLPHAGEICVNKLQNIISLSKCSSNAVNGLGGWVVAGGG